MGEGCTYVVFKLREVGCIFHSVMRSRGEGCLGVGVRAVVSVVTW